MLQRFGILITPAVVVAAVLAVTFVAPESHSYGWVLAASFVYPFVFVPVAFRRQVVRDIDPPIEAFDPARHEVPPWAHAFMQQTAWRLAPESFQATSVPVGLQKPLGATWALVLESDWTGDIAVAMVNWTRIGLGSSQTLVVFRSRFEDGSEMTTTNHPKPTILEDPPPSHVVLRLPEVTDPVALHRIHRALASRATTNKVKLSCKGDPVAFQREASIRENERLVSCGRYVRDERAGVFRPSWPHAIRLAWRNTFPVSLVTRAIHKHRTQALLREIGARA